MNSAPSPYLNVTRSTSIHRGMRMTSSCSTLTHCTSPIPSGKVNSSGSLNGSVVYQPRSTFVDDRRVEALLDRRPDRERRREVVAVDDEVGAVTDADLVDLAEQLVGGVAGRDVGEARARRPCRRAPSGRGSSTSGVRRTGRRRAGCRSSRTGGSGAGPTGSSPCRRSCIRRRTRPLKIGGLKRGSQALRMTSACIDRASSATESSDDGVDERQRRSCRLRRSSRWRPPPPPWSTSMSATVMCVYASRFDAIATKADPTPPAPTTRTRMGRGYFTTSAGRRNAERVINLRTGAAHCSRVR